MAASTTIKEIEARVVFDSRGKKTIEVDVRTQSGFGRAAAPSGASRGVWEVQSYPEGGVDEAPKKVAELIAPKVVGLDSNIQGDIDRVLHEVDDTENFSTVGGNTAYAVSIASAIAAASSKEIPLHRQMSSHLTGELPHPLGNVVGGGMHAKGGKTDIQEFLVLPVRADSFFAAANANIKVHGEVARLLEDAGKPLSGKGDEGAWVAALSTEEAIEALSESCRAVSDETGVEVKVGLDMAASTMWSEDEKAYLYGRDGKKLNEGEQIEFVLSLIKTYGLIYVEDPFREDAFQAFAELTRKAKRCFICGDDLYTTNIRRLRIGLKQNSANSIIIKPNQVGTLTDALNTVEEAKKAGYGIVVSHRSGEVTGWELAHIALGFGAHMIKTGVVGGERIAKINELTRIEQQLKKQKHPSRLISLPLIK